MMEYYTLLCQMPHMKPECLRVPPTEGWPETHAQNLRKEGWSEEAAKITRHLPFLAPGLYNVEHAFIVSLIHSLSLSVNLSHRLIKMVASDLELDGSGF
jgi:hypothetical protein